MIPRSECGRLQFERTPWPDPGGLWRFKAGRACTASAGVKQEQNGRCLCDCRPKSGPALLREITAQKAAVKE